MAGGVQAADFTGNIRLGLQNQDELDVVSGKLVITTVGSSTLDNGLEISYGIEFENDSADSESNTFTNDKSWVGIGGGFGKITLGEHSDMAGWACGGTDILTYGTAEACSLGHNTSPADAIQYRGGAGAIQFGLAITQNGTGESDSLVGISFEAGDLQVGGQFVSAGDDADMGGVSAGESGSAIGGKYALGDITIGLTIGDNGADDDSGGTDIGVSLPLGGGNLAIVISTLDADDRDSQDLLYSMSLSDMAYAGLEFNSKDEWDDDRITGFIGTRF